LTRARAGVLAAALLAGCAPGRREAPPSGQAPQAALIHLSEPDAAGRVEVSGRAGAVGGKGMVTLFDLDTGRFGWADAKADGSFHAALAALGSSILLRYDPSGTLTRRFLDWKSLSPGAAVNSKLLAPLAGVILQVPRPSKLRSPLAFAGGGLAGFYSFAEPLFPSFRFEGAVSGLTFRPGDVLRASGILKIDSPALRRAGAMTANAVLTLERLSEADGATLMGNNSYASVYLTPTGLPIERRARFSNEGLEVSHELDLLKESAERAGAAADLALTLPAELESGYYRPHLTFRFKGVPRGSGTEPPATHTAREGRREMSSIALPIIKVGEPSTPRLHWTLLMDQLSGGTQGVRAMEDRGEFGVASRITTQSETFIVPRLDAANGLPAVYRLEPFAPTIAICDRSPPAEPSVPFRFPSGALTVKITGPDGTTRTLGTAPFAQGRVQGLANPSGETLANGGGQISGVYQLTTLDPRFEVTFPVDGLYKIVLEGSVEDVWGGVWTGGGTYEVHVARALSLDTAVMPGTPFEEGDSFAPGLVVSPPVPADVTVRLRLAPGSDAKRLSDRTINGKANRFGHFQPSGQRLPLEKPGEYRADATASYRDADGNLWMGARTWGGVVAPVKSSLVLHGRRGVDSQRIIGPQWFFRTSLAGSSGLPDPFSGSHLPFPYQSGDVTWAYHAYAGATVMMSAQDLGGALGDMLGRRARYPKQKPGFLEERLASGELPFVSSRPDGLDPQFGRTKIDLWAYTYGAVERPLVRVREIISEDGPPDPYWAFNEQYANQIGAGPEGDLPNDFKFMYGGAVMRGPALAHPEYAIYGALFVLIPADDAHGGTRTFPPFRGNGGGPDAGPLMTLDGRPIDAFLHPTAARAGTVLETGDTFALAGAVAPPLPALVSYTVTFPDGRRRSYSGAANKVGYFYRPADDFIVREPGIYTVEAKVVFKGSTSAGPVTEPFPEGGILGSDAGRFSIYVVPRGSPMLSVDALELEAFPSPRKLQLRAGGGGVFKEGFVTAMMPGFILESGKLAESGGAIPYLFDAAVLAKRTPNLDLGATSPLYRSPAVTITLFAKGAAPGGAPVYAARVVSLLGRATSDLR